MRKEREEEQMKSTSGETKGKHWERFSKTTTCTAVPKMPRPLRQDNIYAAHQWEHTGAGRNRGEKHTMQWNSRIAMYINHIKLHEATMEVLYLLQQM